MAFRASATAGDGATSNVSSLSITIPATAQIGDVAVLNCAGTNTTQTLTTPTGWTLQDNSTLGSGQTWLFTKTLVSGDPGASVSLTWSGTVRPSAAMRVYSGVTLTGATFVNTQVGTAGTSFTVPSMTSVPAGANIDVAVSGRAAFAVADSASFPSPYTAAGSAATAITSSPNSISAGGYEIAGTTGTYGGETVTLGENTSGVIYGSVLPSTGSSGGISFINSAQADNAGTTTAVLTVPSGVTTSHFGVITVALANQGIGAATVPTGWTARDNQARPTGLQTSSAYIFTRNGGVSAGNTVTVTLPSANGATITGVWYDTQGRDVSHVSSLWDTNAQDDATVVFNSPGHLDTRDVLLVAAIRTSATPPTLGTPTGASIDYQHTSTAGGWNAGGIFGHVNGVTAQPYSASWSTGTAHNVNALQLAFEPTVGAGAGSPPAGYAYRVLSGNLNDLETSNTTTVSLPIPASAQVGDVIVVGLIISASSVTLNAPTGWTHRGAGGASGDNINSTSSAFLLTHTVTSGEPGSTTVNFATGGQTGHFVGTYEVYRNATETGFTIAQAIDTPGTNVVLPSIASVPQYAIFGAASLRRYAGSPAQAFHYTSGAYTVEGYVATNYGASPELSAISGWKPVTSSGTYGGETETTIGGSNGCNYVYYVKANGTAYVAAPADTEGITDTVTSVVQGNVRTPADTVGLTDAVTVVRTVRQTYADNVGVTDNANPPDEESTKAVGPDAVGITDAVSTQLTHTATGADTVGLTDAVTIVRQVFQTKADNVGITDTPTTGRTVIRTAADNVGITDTPSTHQDIKRTPADTVGVTDAIGLDGQFSLPVVVTASPDVERQTADLEDVGRLSGTASVQTTASSVDLRVGPQRAKTSVGMSGDLTHVTGLHGTAAPQLDTSLSRLTVVHAMTDIVVRQEIELGTGGSGTGVPSDPAYVGTATVGTSTTAPATMHAVLRPMQMAKETVKKVSRIFRTLR